MRRPAIVLACALALFLAACGGSEETSATGGESAAAIAPGNATAYIAIDTDLDSDQWEQAQELLDRFPGRERLVGLIQEELGQEDLSWEEDIDPALGPETAIVVLGAENDVVVLTQPDDRAKLDALLARLDEEDDQDTVVREIDDWTAIAETEAVLDSFESGADAGTLADDDTFQEAMGELPGEALAKAYAAGDALERAVTDATGEATDSFTGGGRLVSVSVALEALEEGAKLSGATRVEGAGTQLEAYEPALLDRVPDDALAVFGFNNIASGFEQVRSAEGVAPAIAQLEQALGVSLDDLEDLFNGEALIYLRTGTPLPEVTVLLDVDDAAAGMAILDRLAARVESLTGATTGTTDAAGVQVKFVDIQGIRVSYANLDGVLIVTSGATGIRDASEDGDKIADDERFTAAREAAGMGDTTIGFFFVDLKDSIPLLESLAALADEQIPPEVSANLAPLESFFFYGDQEEGEVGRFGAILMVTE